MVIVINPYKFYNLIQNIYTKQLINQPKFILYIVANIK